MVININKAKAGMILERNVYNENGVVVLNSGKTINDSIIESLRKNGIHTIDVHITKEDELKQLDQDIYTTINEQLKNDSIDSLKNLNINKILENSKKIATNFIKGIAKNRKKRYYIYIDIFIVLID